VAVVQPEEALVAPALAEPVAQPEAVSAVGVARPEEAAVPALAAEAQPEAGAAVVALSERQPAQLALRPRPVAPAKHGHTWRSEPCVPQVETPL